jgi:hypothetical protein
MSTMNRKKSIAGYIWASAALAMMLFLMFGSGLWQDILFTKTGVKVSARFTGGEIQNTIFHPFYATQIHQPVFDGFFGDSNKGFVLVDWVTETAFPQTISENIDYDNDGSTDFVVSLDTVENTVEMQALNSKVISVSDEKVMVLKNQRTIRILVKK